MLTPMADRAAHVPVTVRLLFLLVPLALAGMSIVLGRGPYAWFKELQLGWFDGWYPAITILLTVLVCLIPAAVAVQLLAAVLVKLGGEPRTP